MMAVNISQMMKSNIPKHIFLAETTISYHYLYVYKLSDNQTIALEKQFCDAEFHVYLASNDNDKNMPWTLI